MNDNYSVLIPLWNKENPVFLQQCLSSIAAQTVQAKELVFVIDEPLSEKILDTINAVNFRSTKLVFIKAYELKGQGLGALLAKGVEGCSCDLVARMDTDDISISNRCEEELRLFQSHPELDVVGAWLVEFDLEVEDGQRVRNVPEREWEIKKFAKYRNPMNHPTIMFKKQSVLAAGNYSTRYRYCEDYELWYRMLKQGFHFYNIQKPLLYYRKGNNFLERRSRKGNTEAYICLKKEMKKEHYINTFQYFYSVVGQRIFSVLSPEMKKKVYAKLRGTLDR